VTRYLVEPFLDGCADQQTLREAQDALRPIRKDVQLGFALVF
jgi:hypothetical protein